MKEPIDILRARVSDMKKVRGMVCSKQDYNDITKLMNKYINAINMLGYWTKEKYKPRGLELNWSHKFSPEGLRNIKNKQRDKNGKFMKTKISKHDEYYERVEKFAAEIDDEKKVIYIYSTVEDCKRAEKSLALKKLKTLFKYSIQMRIK